MVVLFAPHYCWRAEAEDIVVQVGNPERVKELMQILNQYAVVGPVLANLPAYDALLASRRALIALSAPPPAAGATLAERRAYERGSL
ncbi:hypothetical protein AAWM_08080 [Aspergillus awamori]|uniref:Uncharacterized protein n=1 Tax=Aspergillus awamori TaxID=105351 RepID=A0A401L0T3_ASPAW|nr:hypothetical protein AAWM_08080 [Aspergillus awamori]